LASARHRTASVSERPVARGASGRSLTLAVLCRRPRSSTSTSRLTGQSDDHERLSWEQPGKMKTGSFTTNCWKAKNFSFPVDFCRNQATLDRDLRAPSHQNAERLAGHVAHPWNSRLLHRLPRFESLNSSPPMQESRQRVRNILETGKADRIALYDLLRNDAIIEHFAGEPATVENGPRVVFEAYGPALDATRPRIRVPDSEYSETLPDGRSRRHFRWTEWTGHREFASSEDYAA